MLAPRVVAGPAHAMGSIVQRFTCSAGQRQQVPVLHNLCGSGWQGMAKAKQEAAPVVEELQFRGEGAFLSVLLNRRTRSIRVIDYRAGALPAKRLFIQSVASREQVEKVITLVEKDEVSSWTRVGFVREGTIPAFYKRSDGHLCGYVVGDKRASVLTAASTKRMEQVLQHAKREAKALWTEGIAPGHSGLQPVSARTALGARDRVWKRGEGLGSFDAFGRGGERLFFTFQGTKNTAQYLSAESEACFGHALVEVLRPPHTGAEVRRITAALLDLGEVLQARGILSAFTFTPIDAPHLATALHAAGYRKTGALARGICIGDRRHDALLWSRKLTLGPQDDVERNT
ncbi:MAG: hypothetical protein ACPGUV_03640 [Polyangiales bacterium]